MATEAAGGFKFLGGGADAKGTKVPRGPGNCVCFPGYGIKIAAGTRTCNLFKMHVYIEEIKRHEIPEIFRRHEPFEHVEDRPAKKIGLVMGKRDAKWPTGGL
jgi:hypothetical protein